MILLEGQYLLKIKLHGEQKIFTTTAAATKSLTATFGNTISAMLDERFTVFAERQYLNVDQRSQELPDAVIEHTCVTTLN